MIASVDVKEFLEGFLGEAAELLRTITAQLSSIEAAPTRPHPRAVRELFRALHTLKGLAGMMGLEPIVGLTHAMESLVRAADRGGGSLPSAALDPLVTGVKLVEQRIHALADGAQVRDAPDDLLQTLEQLASGTSGEPGASGGLDLALGAELSSKLSAAESAELQQALEHGENPYSLEFTPSPEKAASGINITSIRESVARVGRIIRVLPVAVPRDTGAPGALKFLLLVVTRSSAAALAEAAGVAGEHVTLLARTERRTPEPPTPTEEDTADQSLRRSVVRVKVEKLDDTLEHLAGVGVCGARIQEQVLELGARGTDVRALQTLLRDHARELRRLRGSILTLRMVPLKEVLEPLPLIVRGLRNAAGKSVRLLVNVGRAELDKTVAERMFPALVHLVRNAVDHGIETPADRLAKGKPEQGTISIEAVTRSSSHLDISVTDDGAGVDPQRVADKAGAAPPANDQALLEILTRPGFSTREQVTATSGRGFGMDIVRQSIEALGGELRLQSRPGSGTTFNLRVPLTVAIVDAFAFEAGMQKFLVPVPMVDEIFEVERDRLVAPPGAAGGGGVQMLERRGETIPAISLKGLLGVQAGPAPETKAIVIRRQGTPYAFMVARMLGQHEVLVRPIADPLVKVPGVAGSADLGDGSPTLVMDLLALSSVMRIRGPEASA